MGLIFFKGAKMKIFKLLVVAILAIFLSACGEDNQSPADVAFEFWTHVANNDVKKALSLVDLTDLSKSSKEEFEAKLSKMAGSVSKSLKGRVFTFETDSRKFSDGTVSVSVTLIKEYKDFIGVYKLKKVDGKWKMPSSGYFK